MPGPPPKDEKLRRRRNRPAGFILLPHAGREGPPPPWPLDTDPEFEVAEMALWEELWHTPQAVEWERLGHTRVVARYCRLVVQAERPFANPRLHPEVRQLEDRLGLTPKSMFQLRWMTDDEAPPEESTGPASSRRRLRAVEE